MSNSLNLPQAAGILVQRIAEGSIGSRFGIHPGTLRANVEGVDLL